MKQTIMGHFDGAVLIPDEPVKLPIGKTLAHLSETRSTPTKKNNSEHHKIIGTGQFCSGISDLASNKKPLAGFGQ